MGPRDRWRGQGLAGAGRKGSIGRLLWGCTAKRK